MLQKTAARGVVGEERQEALSAGTAEKRNEGDRHRFLVPCSWFLAENNRIRGDTGTPRWLFLEIRISAYIA